jgi:hypothetical protein
MFTSPLQKYIDGSTVLNTKFGILPGLVDLMYYSPYRLYREWKVQNGITISMWWDKRPEFNALGQYKDVPLRALFWIFRL